MRKRIELAALLILIAGLIILSRNMGKYVTSDKIETKENTVVIDAGHGGADPGKVGVNEALEKDINLEIAKRVRKLLEEKGVTVIMTREDDNSLAPEGSTNQKVTDMKARVSLIDETAPELAISIHQNSYHEAEIHGAQVFYYSHSTEGEKAAAIMQEALLSADAENTRQAKANDTYYLLKRTQFPTIIIECGFLSNPQEAEKLVSEEYQEDLTKAIVKGILTCLSD